MKENEYLRTTGKHVTVSSVGVPDVDSKQASPSSC
jgi:hypothetical protein